MHTVRCDEVIIEICGSVLLAPKKKGADWRPHDGGFKRIALAVLLNAGRPYLGSKRDCPRP
jgi:hypothetical protein